MDVANPKLWSVDSPNLYWVRTEIIQNGKVVDRTDSRFGIRYIATNPNSGFYLNGVHTKLNGVCEHSDLGSLGMETYQAAVDRRIRTLKNTVSMRSVPPITRCHRSLLRRVTVLECWYLKKPLISGCIQKTVTIIITISIKQQNGKTVVFDKAGNDNTNNDTSYIEVKREDLQSNAERDIKAMVDVTRTHLVFFAWSTGNEIYDARTNMVKYTGYADRLDQRNRHDKTGRSMPADLGQLLGK